MTRGAVACRGGPAQRRGKRTVSFQRIVPGERIVRKDRGRIDKRIGRSGIGERGIGRQRDAGQESDRGAKSGIMATMVVRHFLLVVLGLASGVRAGCPVVSEIAANPLAGDVEWIELANLAGAKTILAGWTIDDGATRRLLDSTAVLPAQGRLVVASDCQRLMSWYGTTSIPCAEASAWNALAVGSDRVVLREANGAVCDSVEWNDASWEDWPKGRSLERIDLARTGNDPANWIATSATLGGTPGWEGAPALEPQGAGIRAEMVSRKVVPGEPRVLARLHAPWNLHMKAELFDLSRRRVAILHDGRIPASGELVWNGAHGGKPVLPGAHMLLLEIGSEKGDVQARFREWIVVAK